MPVTPASAWKREACEVKLPSGKIVLMRRPDVAAVIMSDGKIPDAMSGILFDGIISKKGVKFSKQDFPALLMAVNAILRGTFIHPIVVDDEPDYDAGQISVGDLEFEDKLFVFEWAMGGQGKSAQRFLNEQQATSVGAAREGEGVQPQPVGDVGTG